MRSTTPERLAMCRGEKPAPYKERFVPALVELQKKMAELTASSQTMLNGVEELRKHQISEAAL